MRSNQRRGSEAMDRDDRRRTEQRGQYTNGRSDRYENEENDEDKFVTKRTNETANLPMLIENVRKKKKLR